MYTFCSRVREQADVLRPPRRSPAGRFREDRVRQVPARRVGPADRFASGDAVAPPFWIMSLIVFAFFLAPLALLTMHIHYDPKPKPDRKPKSDKSVGTGQIRLVSDSPKSGWQANTPVIFLAKMVLGGGRWCFR